MSRVGDGHKIQKMICFRKYRQYIRGSTSYAHAEVDFALQAGTKVTDLINVTQTVDDKEVLERELKSLTIGEKEFAGAKSRLLTLYNESKQTDPRIQSLVDFL